MTAQGICQQQLGGRLLSPITTDLLREQWFDWSVKGTRWQSAASASSVGSSDRFPGGEPPYSQQESISSMRSRADSFVGDCILPLIKSGPSDEEVVAVVAHGIILQVLWLSLADLFDRQNIHFGPGVNQSDITDTGPTWSTSAYMEMDFTRFPPTPPLMRNSVGPAPSPSMVGSVQSSRQRVPTPLAGWALTVNSVDNTSHLATKQFRTGPAVRDAVHGSRQETMDDFYRLTGAT